jgi:hypothetical protein
VTGARSLRSFKDCIPVRTPEWLKANDPGMEAMMRELFGVRQASTRNGMLDMRHRASAAA